MTRASLTTLAALVCLWMIPTVGLAQQTYVVRFNRPMKTGETFRQVSQATENQKISLSAAGNVVQQKDDTVNVAFASRARVDAVNEKGRPTKLSHVIEKLEQTLGDQKAVVLQPGDVVVATGQANQVQFTVNDSPVAPELEKLLSMVIAVDTGQPTEDELFGSEQPRKIGETWPISGELAASTMQKMEIQIDPQNVSGEAKLEEAKVEGQPAMLVMSGKMTIKDLKPAGLQGMELSKSSANLHYTTTAPADPAAHNQDETKVYDLSFDAGRAASPDSPAIRMSVEVRRETKTKFEWVE